MTLRVTRCVVDYPVRLRTALLHVDYRAESGEVERRKHEADDSCDESRDPHKALFLLALHPDLLPQELIVEVLHFLLLFILIQ